MKKELLCLILLSAFCFALPAHSIKPKDSLPFNFSTCGIIDASGEYHLTANVQSNQSTPCISINVPFVTLKCDGFTLNGTSEKSTGIQINAGAVQLWSCGVYNYAVAYDFTDLSSSINASTIPFYFRSSCASNNIIGIQTRQAHGTIEDACIVNNARWDYHFEDSAINAKFASYWNTSASKWFAQTSNVNVIHAYGNLFRAFYSNVYVEDTNFTLGWFTSSLLTQGQGVSWGELIQD